MERCSVVNFIIIGIVNDEEPRVTCVGKPSFHVLKALSVCPTQFTHINEGLPCCSFAAGVDPEDAQESVEAPSVSKT